MRVRGAIRAAYRTPDKTEGRSHKPNLLNELILWKRGLVKLDLVSLLAENVLSSLVDVLEKEDLDVLSVEGLQLLVGLLLGMITRTERVWRVEGRSGAGGEAGGVAQGAAEGGGGVDILCGGHCGEGFVGGA